VKNSYGMPDIAMVRRMGRGRLLLLLAAVAALIAAIVVVLGRPAAPADGDPQGGVVQTRWGPLSYTDRVLLVKVRQAGLWEMPAGQQAQQRAASPKLKEVADTIMEQHMQLDADTRATAARLNVILPNQPSVQQKTWLAEMSHKIGADYDRTFVLRLRAAHGKVFSVIAQVRASSQNSLIRAFAERALRFVNTHMTLLESTGLVTDSALS